MGATWVLIIIRPTKHKQTVLCQLSALQNIGVTELTKKGNFRLFAANGKRKWQTSVRFFK
jgi:hypothetical protein